VSYPVTCGDLVRRVRQRACLEMQSGAITFGPQFMPDSEVVDNLNTSISAWYDMVLDSTYAGQYVRAPWPITTTANVSLYPLAPNFYRLISIDCFVPGSTLPITAQPYQEEQRNQWASQLLSGWLPGIAISYMQQGTNLCFKPLPNGTYNVTVNYFPTPPTLNSPSSSIDSVAGWEEWMVLKAAIKCLLKDGQIDMIQVLSGLLAEETDRIKSAAPNRDQGAPERLHVTRGLEWSDADQGDFFGGF
jgi:hypothetical protein